MARWLKETEKGLEGRALRDIETEAVARGSSPSKESRARQNRGTRRESQQNKLKNR